MNTIDTPSKALRRSIVRTILASLSVVNVCLLIGVSAEGSALLQWICIGFGMLSTTLYALDNAQKITVHSSLVLTIYFVNSCVVGFLFDLNPAPLYIFVPSFIASIIVLEERNLIRLVGVLHVLATLVCFSRGDGSLELVFLPSLIFGGMLFTFLVASIIKLISNKKYFFRMKDLQILLEHKREAIELKTENLQDQAKELIRSRLALEEQISDNTQRVHHLKSANEDLGLIAQAASRDLKLPLRAIGTHIDQLAKRLDKLGHTEGLEEYLHYVSDGASRMNAMVDDLLHYCDPSSKHLTTQVCTSDLLEVIQANLSNLLVRENAHIIVQSDMPVIPGHKTEILQLFQNLITNGIKFRKPGVNPVCRIGFSKKSNEICFFVSDNGIGIPANRVNDVFGLFTRLHERSNYEGTGIGLAICRRIVLSAGGEIWAKSTEGVGTTFFFTWPLTSASVVKDTIVERQYA